MEIVYNEEKTTLKGKPSLPNGWTICRSSSYPDTIYYFNINTGCSTWELPSLVKKQSVDEVNAKKCTQTSKTFTMSDLEKLRRKRNGKSKQRTKQKLKDETPPTSVEQPWYIQHSRENSLKNYPEPKGKPPRVGLSADATENESDGSNNYNMNLMNLLYLNAASTQDASPDDFVSNVNSENLIIVKNVSHRATEHEGDDFEAWRRSSLHTRFKMLSDVAEFTADDRGESADLGCEALDAADKSLEPNDLRLLLRARREGGATDFDLCQQDNPEGMEEEQYETMVEGEAMMEHDIQDTEEEELGKADGAVVADTEGITSPLKKVSFDANAKMNSVEDMTSDWDDGCNSDCSDSTPVSAINLDKLARLSLDGVGSLELGFRWYIVVDSSVWLSNLVLVKILVRAKEGTMRAPTILVPWRVLHELDNIGKTEQDARHLTASRTAWKRSSRARRANAFINGNIKAKSCVGARLVGESCQEANLKLFPCTGADDEIINCCLNYATNNHHVIVLSNDKNLCNKALVNNIHAFTVHQIKGLLYDNKSRDSYDSESSSPLNMDKIQLSQIKRTISVNSNVEAVTGAEVETTKQVVQNVELKHVKGKKWGNVRKTLLNTEGHDSDRMNKLSNDDNFPKVGESEKPKTKKIVLKRKRPQDLATTSDNNKRMKIQFGNPKNQNVNQNDLIIQKILTVDDELANTVKKIIVKNNTNTSKANVNTEKEPASTLNLNLSNEHKTDFVNNQLKPRMVTFSASFEELMSNKKGGANKYFEINRPTFEKVKTEKSESARPRVLQQTVVRTLSTDSFSALVNKNFTKALNPQKAADVSESSFSETSATQSDDVQTNASESIISSVDEAIDSGPRNKDVNSRLGLIPTMEAQKSNSVNKIVTNQTIFKIPQDIPQRKRVNAISETNKMTAVKVAVDETSTETINREIPRKERQMIVFDKIEKPIQRVEPVAPAKKERVKIVFDLDEDKTKLNDERGVKQCTLLKDNSQNATLNNVFVPKIQVSMGTKFETTNNTLSLKKQPTFNSALAGTNKKCSPIKPIRPFTTASSDNNANDTPNNAPQNIVFNSDSLNLRNFTNKLNVPPNSNSKPPPVRTNFKVKFASANETKPSLKSLSDWGEQSQTAFASNMNEAFLKNDQKKVKVPGPFKADVRRNEMFKFVNVNNKKVVPNCANAERSSTKGVLKGSGKIEAESVRIQAKIIKLLVDSSTMKKRIEVRLDEWICRLQQIMENILSFELHRSLHLTPRYCLNIFKPPWSFHEALVSLNIVLNQSKSSSGAVENQSLPVESVVDALAQRINDRLKEMPITMSADEYMDIYSHSYNVLYYLKSNRNSEEDYTLALESLELILTDIKNPAVDESYDFVVESEDGTPQRNEERSAKQKQNKKDYNPLKEVRLYLKKHFPNVISDENIVDVNEESSLGICDETAESVAADVVQNETKQNEAVDKIYKKVPDTPHVPRTCARKSSETYDLDALDYESNVTCKSIDFSDQLKISKASMDCAATDLRSIDRRVSVDRSRGNEFHGDALSESERNVLMGIKNAFMYSYGYCDKYSKSLMLRIQNNKRQPRKCPPEVDAGCDPAQIKKLSDTIGILLCRFQLILEGSRRVANDKAYDNLARTMNDLLSLGDLEDDSVDGVGLWKCFDRQKNIMTACSQQFQSLHSALLILQTTKKAAS